MRFEKIRVEPSHPSLFDDDDVPRMPAVRTLVIRPTATRPLNKHERAFNRALQKVQTLRVRLQQEKHRLDQALVFHAGELRPRVERAVSLRTQLTQALAPFLDDRRLKPRERGVLHTMLVEQVDDILAHVEAPDPDVRALFERLHGIAYAQAVQQDLDVLRSDMETMFGELGVDVDVPEFRAGMSEEEVAATTARFVDDMRRAAETAQSREIPNRRKTTREMREDDRAQRVEEMRKSSIGAVYRRLVKVLHPDLETDAAERESKSRMMQDVTTDFLPSALDDMERLVRETGVVQKVPAIPASAIKTTGR